MIELNSGAACEFQILVILFKNTFCERLIDSLNNFLFHVFSHS